MNTIEGALKRIVLVISTCNQSEMLSAMLASLGQTRTPRGYELHTLFFDDQSVDEDVAVLAREYLLTHPGSALACVHHQHCAASMNQFLGHGFLGLGADVVVWVHVDMAFPDPDWLIELLQMRAARPRAGKIASENTVGPESTAPNGSGTDRPGHNGPYLVTREAFEHVTGKYGHAFDPAFEGYAGWDDWDFNAKLLEGGFEVLIAGRSRVYHRGSGTRANQAYASDEMARRNQCRYYERWKTWAAPV